MIVKRLIHHSTSATGHEETWHYIARDSITDEVFILKEREDRGHSDDERISIKQFVLKNGSTVQRKFLDLIGSLVVKKQATRNEMFGFGHYVSSSLTNTIFLCFDRGSKRNNKLLLSHDLSSDSEIDEAIDILIADLEQERISAKAALQRLIRGNHISKPV